MQKICNYKIWINKSSITAWRLRLMASLPKPKILIKMSLKAHSLILHSVCFFYFMPTRVIWFLVNIYTDVTTGYGYTSNNLKDHRLTGYLSSDLALKIQSSKSGYYTFNNSKPKKRSNVLLSMTKCWMLSYNDERVFYQRPPCVQWVLIQSSIGIHIYNPSLKWL